MDTAFLDHLAVEIQAFQEGFEIVSNAKSLEDFAQRFCHIVRGSLIVSYVNLYARQPPEAVIQPVCLQRPVRAPVETPGAQPFALHPAADGNAIQAQIDEKDGTVFFLLLGPRIDREPWSPFDKLLIHLFIQLLDHGYQGYRARQSEQHLTFSLNHRILQLNQIIDTGIELSRMKRSGSLLELAIRRLAGLVNASLVEVHTRKGVTPVFNAGFPQLSSTPAPKEAFEKGTALRASFEFGEETFEFTVRSKESRGGSVPFDETDRAILDAVVRQVSAAVENDFLQSQLLDKRAIERELHIASLIQKKILPAAMPDVRGYDIAGTNLPSKEVSGDYFDCYALSSGEVVLIMADVAGKGFPASLLVSTLHASVHTSVHGGISLSELAARLNDLIFRSSTPDRFITCFMGILDPGTGQMRYVNAGHPPPLILSGGVSLTDRHVGGLPLGCVNGSRFTERKIELVPGARMLLFTDGIPEALNERNEFYSDEALEELFVGHGARSAQEFVYSVVQSLKDFCGPTPLSDDVTAIYLRRES